MKRKPNPNRPGRGTKGEHNPMLPPELQGRKYRVCEFVLQPILLFYDDEGQEDGRRPSQVNLSIAPSSYRRTVPEIMERAGLKMEGGKL
jgi:hypothetical protein